MVEERAQEAETAAAVGHWPLVSRLTYLIIGLYALTFSTLSILAHDAYTTQAFDLGNMDQAVWNTLYGRWFAFTNWDGGTTRLAAHVEPILVLVAQFYRLYSSPRTLLVLQSVVLALGALPAFWLARDRLRSEFAAVTFASAYLLSPALEAANLHDFHAVALASSFLLFAFYFAHRRRDGLFLLFAVLAMSTKEHVPASVALMGVYLAVIQGRRAIGIFTIVLSLAWLWVAMGVIIPANNPFGVSPYLSRYDQLGGSPLEMLRLLFSQPERFLAEISQPAKLDYLRQLLTPVAYLSLLHPPTLLLALPDVSLNVLSNFAWMYSGTAHYGSVIVPFVIISGIFGTATAARVGSAIAPGLGRAAVHLGATAVIASSVLGYYQQVFLPLSDHLPSVTPHHELASEFIRWIPADAGVSASSTLNPHVSQRERLYLFPELQGAEFVFLDVTATPHPIDAPSLEWRVRRMLNDGWGVFAARDGYLLLRKGLEAPELSDEFLSFARVKRPVIERRLDVAFGTGLRFLGYSLQPGTVLHGFDPYATADLYWQVTTPVERDYLLALYLVDSAGRLVSTQAYHPATVWYPLSRWQVGEIVRVRVLRLPLDGRGRLDVWLGVVDGKDLQDPSRRLAPTVLESDGQPQVNEDGTLLRLFRLVKG